MVKYNWDESHLDFYQKIKYNVDFINKVQSSVKYDRTAIDVLTAIEDFGPSTIFVDHHLNQLVKASVI